MTCRDGHHCISTTAAVTSALGDPHHLGRTGGGARRLFHLGRGSAQGEDPGPVTGRSLQGHLGGEDPPGLDDAHEEDHEHGQDDRELHQGGAAILPPAPGSPVA